MKKLVQNISILPVFLRLLAILMLFTISRVLFYYFNQKFYGPVNLFTILKGGIRFDIVAVLYLNIVYILLFFVPHNHKTSKIFLKISNGIFIITNSLGLLLNSIDTAYYPFSLKRSSFATVLELGKLNNGNELLKSFMVRYWYVWAIWLCYILVICFIVFYIKHFRNKTPLRYQVDASFISLFLIVAGLRGGDLRHATRPIGLNNAGEYVNKPNEVSIVLNTPFSIFKTLSDKPKNKLVFFKTKQELEAQFNPVFSGIKGPMNKQNIVIFIIESYSEEASGVVNKNELSGGFTPFLDSLRQHSLYTMHSFANGKKSIEAPPSILCSIPSFESPFALSSYASNKINSLPNLLKSEGYHSAFFHGAPNGSMGFQAFANLIGFDAYFGKDEYPNQADYDGIWGIWDEPFLQFMAQKTSTFKEPFLSTVFTLSSHDPFKIPEKYKGKFRSGPHPIYETLGYTDFAIKRFFDFAKTQAWYKNTLFVFTADHTSSHASLPEFSNNVGRFRVPIFFFKPDNSLEKNSNDIFQQIDIMPSVLRHLNYPKPFLAFGQNVFDTKSEKFAINYFEQYQWIQGDNLLTINDQFSTKFYKLLKGQVKVSNIGNQGRIEKKAKAFLQQYQNRMIENKLTP